MRNHLSYPSLYNSLVMTVAVNSPVWCAIRATTGLRNSMLFMNSMKPIQ